MLNAERRAVQQRCDDAVGRLFRALELLAQIRLSKEYNIQTGDVAIHKVPEFLQPKYGSLPINSPDGKIQLGLEKSYVLLSELPDDSLGKIYQQQASKIKNALHIRNYSLFAHGFSPIMKGEYQAFSEVVVGFITSSIAILVPDKSKFQPVQFPQELDNL